MNQCRVAVACKVASLLIRCVDSGGRVNNALVIHSYATVIITDEPLVWIDHSLHTYDVTHR